MSLPPSEGRLSTSSMPSFASSPTLNSRYSGAYADNGVAGPSQRPSLAGSRHNSTERNDTPEQQSQSSGSALSTEAIGEQGFAQRKRTNRRSGGFLLNSAFSSGPRSRHAQDGGRAVDVKGKQSSRPSQTRVRGDRADRLHAAASNLSTRSPLSREVAMADAGPADMEEQGAGGVHVAKTGRGAPETASTTHPAEQYSDSTTPRPVFDPNQIVTMALNLSESRRRNLSAGQLLTPQPRVSSGAPKDGSFHSHGPGSGQLRQYLNEQRRMSRNISPFGDRSTPGRHIPMSAQRRGSVLIHGQQINPSEATLARAGKAQAFIELRVEYLRLLEFLPPLKPDSTAPGNFIVTANNLPGSPCAQLTRMPSHTNAQYELGRPYNPLQLLRNRRSRARERRPLDHQPEEFADVQQVRKWVDNVEEAARSPHYRQLDGVALPRIHGDHERVSEPPKPSRPNKVWMFTIEELLADAHWLEHGDNKTIVEDRHGRKIFPTQEPRKQDFLQPRPSNECPENRRKGWIEGLPGIGAEHNTTGDESEPSSERGRKRRLLPTFRAESPNKLKKHLWSGSKQQAGSYTDSSDSDSDNEKHRSRKTQKMVDGANDTGPLALRMKQLMEKEGKETQTLQTPVLFTPDTPDKWGHHADIPGQRTARSSFELPDSASGSAKMNLDLGLKLPPKQRADLELSRDPSKEYRSSFDEFDSTTPNTPLHLRFPHTDDDLSPPSSRAGLEQKKSKKSKLDFLRSDESKANKHEHPFRPGSASSDKKEGSQNASEEVEEGTGIGSVIWAAPGAVKNFLGHRKNDSVSSLTSPVKDGRKDQRDLKEPHSAVTRFIKVVKNEGSKVGEFIFRKDRQAEDSDTDLAEDHLPVPDSGTDEEKGSFRRRRRPSPARRTIAVPADSIASNKNKGYHLELPSFRSSYQSKADDDTDSELSDHHISRQARETAKNRSPRFDKLAPPRMDLSGISYNTSPLPNQDRISKVLTRPGGVGHAGLPVTALAQGEGPNASNGGRSSSRPTLEGKRQWSITDEHGNVLSRKATSTIVSQSDIARVRALFLCSGIKAKEINRGALEVRENPPSFLIRAAKTANAELYGVPRKEEHVLAARILLNDFEASVQSLRASADQFREHKVAELTSRISSLKSTVESDLFTRVRQSGDEAVKATSWVSSDAPLTIKQITDDIDHMLRMRRRRTRWIRRVGWTSLEWMLLGFMWFAWLIVTLSRVVRRTVGFAWRLLRWLLWL